MSSSASQAWIPASASDRAWARPISPGHPEIPARPLTLGDLIDLALRDNPDTRHSWQVAVQAAATANRAMDGFLPQLGASYNANKNYSKTDGALTAYGLQVPEVEIVNSPGIFTSPGASVTWMLWDFGTTKAGWDAARAGLLSSNLVHNRTIQGVVRQVQLAYFNYDAAQGALAAADASAEAANGTLSAAQMRHTSGLSGYTEEMQARQSVMSARMQREQSRRAFQQARSQLFEIAGLPPTANVTIAEQAPGTEPQPALGAVDSLIAQAINTRPDLAARYAKISALELDLKRVRRGFLPTVAFVANANRIHGEQSTLTSQGVDNPAAVTAAQISRYTTAGYIESASAGLAVNADITSFFTYSHQVAAKRAEIDAARADLHTALITAQHDVWLGVDACQSARTEYEEAKQLLDLSGKAFDASKQAHQSGLQSSLDLLTAQQSLAQARYTLVTARARLFTSAIELAYATGQTPMTGGGGN